VSGGGSPMTVITENMQTQYLTVSLSFSLSLFLSLSLSISLFLSLFLSISFSLSLSLSLSIYLFHSLSSLSPQISLSQQGAVSSPFLVSISRPKFINERKTSSEEQKDFASIFAKLSNT
jgi:hypothetical protein